MTNKTVNNIEFHLSCQHDINAAYDEFLSCMHMELDKVGSMPDKPRTSSGKTFYKRHWSDALQSLWV